MMLLQLPWIAPQIWLGVWALVMLVYVACCPRDGAGGQLLALVGLGLGLALHMAAPVPQALLFVVEGGGPLLALSPLSALTGMATLLLLMLVLPLTGPFFDRVREPVRPEWWVLLLLLATGLSLMGMASDFVTLYVALELASFASYVLVAWRREDGASSEAALKYFVLGSLATVLMLFGVALLYAVAGTTNFVLLNGALAGAGVQPLVLAALVLVVGGVLFKLSVAPFHAWTPDVYEGAPTPMTAVLAVVPKVAALVVLLRLLGLPLVNLVEYWQPLLAVAALVSMVLGAVMAVIQDDLKRLLAWSTVANMGFMLCGLVAANVMGWAGSLFYVLMYGLANVVLFGLVIATGARRVSDLDGLGKKRPGLALAASVALLSLAGIPPLAGFMAKLGVFGPLVSMGYAWLAVVGVLCSVVAAGYCLMLLKALWFMPPRAEGVEVDDRLILHLILVAILLGLMGIWPSMLQGLLVGAVMRMY